MNQRTTIKPLILLLLIWIGTLFPAQGLNLNLDLNAYTIQFSSKEMSLKQALDELFLHKEFNIVYGGKEIDVDVPIVFTSRTLKLKEALSQIEKQAPVEFIIDNNHVIVKKRKLETSYVISGRVVDAATHEGLVAANVFIAGTTTGVVTDNDGNFSMRLPPNTYRLIFRYVGYTEQSFRVNLFKDVQLKTVMEVKENEIQSVDVTGSFSVIENMQPGRTIETIESKVIDRLNTNNVSDALHARLNGVWTTKVSGAPGDHLKIRIRGISSIFGSTDPLFVVDGTTIPIVNFENLGIADLNVHDIEKITVLKDASSTALYGNLGGNGVIVIETKKGGGATEFSFMAKQGYQQFTKRYDLLGAEDFLTTLRRSDGLINTQFYYRNPSLGQYEKYPEHLDVSGNPLPETDFQNMLFQTGKVSEYQFSAKGQFKGLDYYLSGNYFDHNGIVVNSNYRKYSFTANLSKSINEKLSFRLLYKGSNQENTNTLDNYLGNNVILKGINYEPAYLATPDSFLRKGDRLFFNKTESPSVAMLSNCSISPQDFFYKYNKVKTDVSNTLNLQGLYKITPELLFRANVSGTLRKQVYSSNMSTSLSRKINYLITGFAPKESGYSKELRSSESYIYFNQQYNLSYTHQVKNHLINAFLQFRNYKDNVYWQVDSLNSLIFNSIKPQDDVYIRGSQALYGYRGSVLRKINSLIFNINYTYKNKFTASVMLNYENLTEGQYVSDGNLFKSVALNYDLAREQFLHVPKWINACNVFVNWGQAGNYPLNSLSNDIFSSSSVFSSGDSLVSGVGISNLANYDLRPERVTETNYGLEFKLLKERVILSADYYRKINNDLLIKRTIPFYYGGGFIYQNIGQMKNSGWELSLEVVPINNTNAYWSSKVGFSTNNQYITRLDEGVPITFNNIDVLIPDFVAFENEPLGAIYGYKYLGLWKDYFDPKYRYLNPLYAENKGLAYERNDTVINRNVREPDKTIIGNSLPDFTMNWINSFEYKNFSVEMFWYGVFGVDKYNATKASTFLTGTNRMVKELVLDTIKCLTSNVFYESSYFIEDASFIRLKTLNFTYTPKIKLAGKIQMEYTLSFENLITLTKYSGYDPEAAIYTNNNFTDNAIDKGAYPSSKGIYFSIRLNY